MNYDTLSFLAGLFGEPADPPIAMLDDGDAYERGERAAIVWADDGPAAEVEWPGPTADFVLLLAPDDLPSVPFALNGWTTITDAERFLRSLRADIARGPSGPRAFYGALQADLLALQRFVLQAAENESARTGDDPHGEDKRESA